MVPVGMAPRTTRFDFAGEGYGLDAASGLESSKALTGLLSPEPVTAVVIQGSSECVTHPKRDVKHVRDPHAADRKPILGRDAHRVALLVERHLRRIVDLHDRVSGRVDKRQSFGRSLRCCHKAVRYPTMARGWSALSVYSEEGRGRGTQPRFALHVHRVAVGEVVNCVYSL